MKTFTKVLLGIVGGALILGIVLAGIGLSFGARNGFSWNGSAGREKIELVVDEKNLEEFTSIDVTSEYGDIVFVESDTYGLEIRTSLSDEYYSYKNENGKLTVEVGTNGKHNFSSWGLNLDGLANLLNHESFDGESIKVYLPKRLDLDTVTVNCDSGNVKLANFNAGSLDIDNDFGDVTISDINAKTTVVNLSSGMFKATNLETDNFTYENDFGDTRFDSVKAELLSFTASSGNVTGNNCSFGEVNGVADFGDITFNSTTTDSLDIDCSSGRLTFEGTYNSANISADFGDIEFKTTKPKSDYNLDLNVDFGEIYINRDSRGTEYSSDNDTKPLIEINSSSGDIKMFFGD